MVYISNKQINLRQERNCKNSHSLKTSNIVDCLAELFDKYLISAFIAYNKSQNTLIQFQTPFL